MDYNAIVKQYPYLADKPIDFVYTPDPKSDRYLEFYSREETGGPDTPRPKDLRMGRYGIQVIQPTTRPIDVLADYVSHAGVKEDPVLQQLYQEFKTNTPDAVMRQRYEAHKTKFKEKRPYSQWLEMTGYPELFRGYPFDQFGPNAEELYSPKQLQVLNKVKSYLGLSAPEPIPEPAFMYKDPFGYVGP